MEFNINIIISRNRIHAYAFYIHHFYGPYFSITTGTINITLFNSIKQHIGRRGLPVNKIKYIVYAIAQQLVVGRDRLKIVSIQGSFYYKIRVILYITYTPAFVI